MGTWTPGLYQNDISDDIKLGFIDKCKRGHCWTMIDKMNMWLVTRNMWWWRHMSWQIKKEQRKINCINLKIITANYLRNYLVFMKNINKRKWTFEVVEEFYSAGRALYIGMIHNKKKKHKSFWCCVKLQFKELLYLWNEIRYDCHL